MIETELSDSGKRPVGVVGEPPEDFLAAFRHRLPFLTPLDRFLLCSWGHMVNLQLEFRTIRLER